MATILRGSVLTMGGRQEQLIGVKELIGVKVGEFLLCPDSNSGTRPDTLRVEGRTTTLLVKGGEGLIRVELHSEGIPYVGFRSRLTREQEKLLARLASNLHGRIWPDAGETLLKRVEEAGEDNVLQALQSLFKGVEVTLSRINLCRQIPIIGKRLEETFFPTA